jgi:homoserine kinase
MVGLEMEEDDGMGLGGSSSMAGAMADATKESMTKMNEGMSKMAGMADSMTDNFKESMLGGMTKMFRK